MFAALQTIRVPPKKTTHIYTNNKKRLLFNNMHANAPIRLPAFHNTNKNSFTHILCGHHLAALRLKKKQKKKTQKKSRNEQEDENCIPARAAQSVCLHLSIKKVHKYKKKTTTGRREEKWLSLLSLLSLIYKRTCNNDALSFFSSAFLWGG